MIQIVIPRHHILVQYMPQPSHTDNDCPPHAADEVKSDPMNCHRQISPSLATFSIPPDVRYNASDPMMRMVNTLDSVHAPLFGDSDPRIESTAPATAAATAAAPLNSEPNVHDTSPSLSPSLSPSPRPSLSPSPTINDHRIFYELHEICFARPFTHPVQTIAHMCLGTPMACYNVLNVSPRHTASEECIRRNLKPPNVQQKINSMDMNEFNLVTTPTDMPQPLYDFIFMELDDPVYDLNMSIGKNARTYLNHALRMISFAFGHQSMGGAAVLKLSSAHHPHNTLIADLIYIASICYHTVVLIKPQITPDLSFTYFFVCIQMQHPEQCRSQMQQMHTHADKDGNEDKNGNEDKDGDEDKDGLSFDSRIIANAMPRIIANAMPRIIKNKIEEFNARMYHTQSETYAQYLRLTTPNLFLNSSSSSTLSNATETLRVMRIQQTIQWCKDNNVSCKRIAKPPNMFLRDRASSSIGLPTPFTSIYRVSALVESASEPKAEISEYNNGSGTAPALDSELESESKLESRG